jgi:hypothetical protein
MTARREGVENKLAESKYPGRFYKMRATIPAAEAFRPLKDGDRAGNGCAIRDLSPVARRGRSANHNAVTAIRDEDRSATTSRQR